ncbi:MAG: hypothetical protein QM698_04960 [Micropepsaceae bacterium]
MTFRDIWRAALIGALLLGALAALALGALTWSVGHADHDAIRRALAAAEPQELGVPLLKRPVRGFEAGYFPDCAGLAILTREDRWPDPAIAAVRADTILPDGIEEMCRRLQVELTGGDDGKWFTYARYWHGALLLHRAVLSGGSYADLQRAAAAVVGLALVVLLAGAAWRVGAAPGLLLVLSLALLTDARTVIDLPVQAVGFAAMLMAVAGFAAFGAGRTGIWALVAAALSGAALNFFDFLYTPAAFAMLNAWVWLAAVRTDGKPRSWFDAALIFGASLGGYAAFWALKWAIAFGFDPSGQQIFIFGANEFTRWGPATGATWPLKASGLAVAATFDMWWKGATALVLIAAALVLRRMRGGAGWPRVLLLLVPVLPALLVIEVMAAHTINHLGFTFRIVPAVLAILAASLALRYTAPEARKAAISAAE